MLHCGTSAPMPARGMSSAEGCVIRCFFDRSCVFLIAIDPTDPRRSGMGCITSLIVRRAAERYIALNQSRGEQLEAGDDIMAPTKGDVDTLTRADLADALHRTVGLSRNDALHLVEQILARMTDALAAGENVKITNFGTFLLNDKAERVGRNPKTGVEVPVSARRVVTFRPSQGLRDQVAGSPAT